MVRSGLPLAILGFSVTVAAAPMLSSPSVPRWWVIAATPLLAWCDPMNIPVAMRWLIALGMGYSGLTLAWSPDPLGGGFDLFKIGLILLVMFAAAETGDIDMAVECFGWGLAISAVLCVLQVAGLINVPNTEPPAGLLINRDFLAEPVAIVLVWAIAARRAALAIVMLFPLMLCGSRVALLAAAAGLFFLPDKRFRYAVVLLIPIVAAYTFLPGAGKLFSLSQRLEIWSAAINGLTVFGRGGGWFAWRYPSWEFVHSDALQFVVEYGIGALPFAALLGWLLAVSRPSPRRAAFAVAVVEICIAFPLRQPVTAFVVAVLAGSLAADLRVIRAGGRIGGTFNRQSVRAAHA